MAYATRETILKYVYLAFGCVFVASLVLLAFMKGITPFNTHASYDATSLVLTQAQAEPAVGKHVARAGVREGQVELFNVLEAYRQDGGLYYRVSPVSGSANEETIEARSAQHVVIATLPVLGLWVRALGHPIGALALLGIPLLTFALDLLFAASGSRALRTIRRTFAYIERRREARRQKQYEADEEDVTPVYEEVVEEVRQAPATFGMTVHLSRPRRYSI